MDKVPCRVSADLRQLETAQELVDRARTTPDFSEPEDLADLVVSDLRQPIADLFATRAQIRALNRSRFEGFVNHPKASEWLLADLDRLEDVLKRLWEAA